MSSHKHSGIYFWSWSASDKSLMAADDGRGGFPGQLHVPGIRRVKCGMPTCDQEVIVKPSKLLAGLAGKEVNQAQMV